MNVEMSPAPPSSAVAFLAVTLAMNGAITVCRTAKITSAIRNPPALTLMSSSSMSATTSPTADDAKKMIVRIRSLIMVRR